MTDSLLEFMKHLRSHWPNIQVVARHHIKGEANHIGVAIERWVQSAIGGEVTLSVSYYPPEEAPMKAMLAWLNEFFTLIQTMNATNTKTQWWSQTAEFDTDPMRVTCKVVIRSMNEAVQ